MGEWGWMADVSSIMSAMFDVKTQKLNRETSNTFLVGAGKELNWGHIRSWRISIVVG